MNLILKKSAHFFCLLLASLGIGLTGCSKKNYSWSTEEEYYKLPIWREHVKTYKKLNYPPNTAKIFIGDSMTEGFDLQRHFDNKDLVNMGIGGDFTSGVIDRLKYAIRLHPKSIFIMIGINDILKDTDMGRIKAQYASILQILKAECPGTLIFVQSNLPTSMMGGSIESNQQVLLKVHELNMFLKDYCNEYEITFIDMYTSFTTERGDLKAEYTYDGLHLSDEGYIVWKKSIQTLIDR